MAVDPVSLHAKPLRDIFNGQERFGLRRVPYDNSISMEVRIVCFLGTGR
jgi:hypothetical protein